MSRNKLKNKRLKQGIGILLVLLLGIIFGFAFGHNGQFGETNLLHLVRDWYRYRPNYNFTKNCDQTHIICRQSGVENFKIDSNKNTLLWCDERLFSGLGNRLGRYYIHRSIAFWLNLSFIIDEKCFCHHHHDAFCQEDTHKLYFTQYLPYRFEYSLQYLLLNQNNIIYNNISITPQQHEACINYSVDIFNYYKILWPSGNVSNSQPKTKFFKPDYSSIAFTNKFFAKIIRYEMQKAFNEYFSQRKHSQSILNEYKHIQSIDYANSAIIHWRCGDILQTDYSKSAYAFDSLSYYKNIAKTWNLTNTTNVNVLILTSLDMKHARRQDMPFINDCSSLLSVLKKSLSTVFPSIQTIVNGTVNSDMFLLSHSKYVSCGFSTFCSMAALANENNVILFKTPKNSKFMQHLPKNIKFIVSKNRIHGGHNISEIADYIINH